MSLKQYTILKLLVVIILAMTISISVFVENYIIPIVAIIISMAVMYYFKKRVKGVLADERDYKIAGKAAMWSLCLFSSASVIVGMLFLALSKSHPSLGEYAHFLFYVVCAVMLMNSFLFYYFRNKGN